MKLIFTFVAMLVAAIVLASLFDVSAWLSSTDGYTLQTCISIFSVLCFYFILFLHKVYELPANKNNLLFLRILLVISLGLAMVPYLKTDGFFHSVLGVKCLELIELLRKVLLFEICLEILFTWIKNIRDKKD